jgi:AraC-like DNA-binding protein
VLTVVQELVSYRDLDHVLRRAVELCRVHIGIERLAIFLYDDAGVNLHGTWGTNLRGETTDEHHTYFTEGFHHREAKAQALGGLSSWLVFADVPLVSQAEDGEVRVIGSGWNVITPIISQRGVLGIVANDTARTNTPFDHQRQTHLATLCRLLGGIIEDLRRSAAVLPWPSILVHPPWVGEAERGALVVAAVQALHEDATLTAPALSRMLGVTAARLAQSFKEAMGVSLIGYKNRLRIERFFTLVSPEGGNLLQAALDAGFGSYAQFHRVFRELMGTTPREYLAARK